MKFYKKQSVLDLVSKQTKLQMNWDIIKAGGNVNEVFKFIPVGLDTFLTNNTISPIKTSKLGLDDECDDIEHY